MATMASSTGRVTVTLAERAVWSTSYIDSLPDSSFLYIESGGKKDGENKTVPRSLRHFPYKDTNGNVDLPHLRNALARIPQSNLPAGVKASATAKARRILANQGDGNMTPRDNPPRENLVRGMFPSDMELRESADSAMPTLTGHFSVFDDWTEIHSAWEGQFLERIDSGAFDKTFAENRKNMRVLFNHGKDPSVGNKVLGPIAELGVDERGAWYDVPLFDTTYNRDLLPGLEAGVYGASFRFKVMRENFDKFPEPSDSNPDGMPERTILEAKVMEFGPVTFPAYEGATAGVRSLTDDYIITSLFGENAERTREFLQHITGQPDAPSTSAEAAPGAPRQPERRVLHYPNDTREDFLKWLTSQS